MGMYPTKNCNYDALDLDTKWLKDNGYFDGYKTGSIKWTWVWGHESSISITVLTIGEAKITFDYTIDKGTTDEKSMNYTFPLRQVKCNLGGHRWAFECSLYSNGVYCGRRVYTLFKIGSDFFGCRTCMRIVYKSQRLSGRRKYAAFGRAIQTCQKIEELEAQITKWHYQGRPTKKVVRLNRLYTDLSLVKDIPFARM